MRNVSNSSRRGNNPSKGKIKRSKYSRQSIKKIPKEEFCSSTWKHLKTNIKKGDKGSNYSSASIRLVRLSREYLQFLISKQLLTISIDSGNIQFKLTGSSGNNLADKVGIIDESFVDNTYKIYKKLPDYAEKNNDEFLTYGCYINKILDSMNSILKEISDKDINIEQIKTEFVKKFYDFNFGFASPTSEICDYNLPEPCIEFVSIKNKHYLIFGHVNAQLIEYFLQKYEGKSLLQHFLDMRKNYSTEEEKEDFSRMQELLKINSPILKTGVNEIPQFIKNILLYEKITEGKTTDDIKNFDQKIIDSLEYLTNMCLGKLSTNIKYYFHIFEFNDSTKEFIQLGKTIKDLKKEHSEVLIEVQKKVKNFLINKLKLRKDTDTNDKFHNILCHFKYPSNGLVLHADYLPPFIFIREYQHQYENRYTLDYIIEILKQKDMKSLNFYVSTSNSDEKYYQELIQQNTTTLVPSQTQQLIQTGGYPEDIEKRKK